MAVRRAEIAGNLIADMSPEDLAEYVNTTGGVLVPGTHWEDASAEVTKGSDRVVISARVTYDENEAIGGDYPGQIPTTEFIASYVLGAGDYWLGSGDLFSPESASFAAA